MNIWYDNKMYSKYFFWDLVSNVTFITSESESYSLVSFVAKSFNSALLLFFKNAKLKILDDIFYVNVSSPSHTVSDFSCSLILISTKIFTL